MRDGLADQFGTPLVGKDFWRCWLRDTMGGHMAPVYLVAEIDVTDADAYENYKRLSTKAMNEFDVRIFARGGRVQNLEGSWNPGRVVIIAFNDFDQANQFYESEAYSAARKARQNASITKMILVEGFPGFDPFSE
ncbi:MAG: DUF1330 domain-containing protein [Thauera sp.]|jgi:uncharacterized protein (DUF1330 family)|nr:DUF1330 domain-containing protein [Thauera sp.]